MSECNHDCEHCSSSGSCSNEIPKAVLNEHSSIKKVIGVLSGKGGVGKSFITCLTAVNLAKKGFKVGILDADITGPSVPKAFGIKERASGDDNLIYPILSKKYKIKLMSANFLLEDEKDPIIWRGIMLANLVKQFYEQVLWEDLDYLLIDMPPGTGDISLTTFQTLPIDDLIIVTSPQELVSLIVAKAINMANMMHIHVLGVVENMSYIKCNKCGEHLDIFGKSHLDEFAKEMKFDVLGKLPLVSENATLVDQGKIEDIELPEIDDVVNKIVGDKK